MAVCTLALMVDRRTVVERRCELVTGDSPPVTDHRSLSSAF
jgi:hypothetical protein